jgi:hypothetical protein
MSSAAVWAEVEEPVQTVTSTNGTLAAALQQWFMVLNYDRRET